MPKSADTVYLDSSAIAKMVVREPESDALARFLAHRPVRVSCALARVEVIRAVRAQGSATIRRGRHVLQRIRLLRLDDELLDAAAEIDPDVLRSLDAIHLAAARTLGSALDELVTYDTRLAQAAESLGLTVAAPGA